MLAFDRANVSKLVFQHNRNTWMGTARALFGATPSVTVQLHKVSITNVLYPQIPNHSGSLYLEICNSDNINFNLYI